MYMHQSCDSCWSLWGFSKIWAQHRKLTENDHYPKCKFASWDKPLEENCTECGNYLVEHKDKIKCRKCDYSKED